MSPRILCVEDHLDIASYLKLLLAQNGYDVVVAGNFEQGRALAETQRFELILLDNGLPDGTGLELCRHIRTFDSATPIVFYSASYDPILKIQALAAGAQEYVKKNSGLEVLLSALATQMAKAPRLAPLLQVSA